MDELIEYILRFGNLNKQQIDLIRQSATEKQLRKDEYFSEAGKIPKQVGFVVEGVIRGCYYNNKGDEITRCFISENNLVVDIVNFESSNASSEYLQACTDCKLIVFSKQNWEELSHTIVGWDTIKNKMVQLSASLYCFVLRCYATIIEQNKKEYPLICFLPNGKRFHF